MWSYVGVLDTEGVKGLAPPSLMMGKDTVAVRKYLLLDTWTLVNVTSAERSSRHVWRKEVVLIVVSNARRSWLWLLCSHSDEGKYKKVMSQCCSYLLWCSVSTWFRFVLNSSARSDFYCRSLVWWNLFSRSRYWKITHEDSRPQFKPKGYRPMKSAHWSLSTTYRIIYLTLQKFHKVSQILGS